MPKKPMLSVDEQIERLKGNGIRFQIVSEDDAKKYLLRNNNYFKLTSYRKNFDKYPCGEKAGQYIDLDFAYLKDLAIIDMHLRYILLEMSLDVEHYAKQKLLHLIEQREEDGYDIVAEFIDSLKPKKEDDKDYFQQLQYELDRNRSNPYCGGIIDTYNGEYPVWAFLEVIPFGRFIYFYRFVAEKFNIRAMKDESYLLQDIRMLRNACAHNNCILNDLSPQTNQKKPNYALSREIAKASVSKDIRDRKLSNLRLRHIVTLLYTHRLLVTSIGVHSAVADKLHDMVDRRMYEHIDFYTNNHTIKTTMDFIKKLVDSWFFTKNSGKCKK